MSDPFDDSHDWAYDQPNDADADPNFVLSGPIEHGDDMSSFSSSPTSSRSTTSGASRVWSQRYAPSTAPSSQVPLPRPVLNPQQLQSMHFTTPIANSNPRVPRLFCEFSTIDGCSETFGLDDQATWLDHHTRHHFRDKFPKRSTCWFCDDFTFDSASSQMGHSKRYAFEARMEHIRGHIWDGSSVNHKRHDFFVIDHLYKKGIINANVYQTLIQDAEGSAGMDFSANTLDQPADRGLQVAHDLEAERRHMRKQKHQHRRHHH